VADRATAPSCSRARPRCRILSEATSSPTIEALRRKLVEQLPGAVWVEYEALSWDNERAGTRMAFGQPVRPIAKLDQAHTIVALDCDLFIEHPRRHPVQPGLRQGPSRRQAEQPPVGHREHVLVDRGHGRPPAAAAVRAHPPGVPGLDAALAGGVAPTSEALAEGKVARFLQVLAEELREQNGKAVLVAGRRQPAQVHALVAKINGAIGAVGNTLTYVNDPEPERQLSHLDAISKLTREMTDKQVETLIILGGNPVYDAPADLGFAAALAGVASTVHLSEHANETSMACAWHVPRAHNLETWTDARTWDGTYTLGQPVILPLYGGVSPAELLSLVLGDEKTGDVLAADTFKALGKGTWRKAVHDGFVADTGYNTVGVALQALAPVTLAESQRAGTAAKNGALEVTFVHSTSTWDGRFANNPWLQETPDFLTKVTWDNYAMVSPATAEALGLSNDTLINVKVGDRNVEVACYTMPGQARGSIALVLGGGRTRPARSAATVARPRSGSTPTASAPSPRSASAPASGCSSTGRQGLPARQHPGALGPAAGHRHHDRGARHRQAAAQPGGRDHPGQGGRPDLDRQERDRVLPRRQPRPVAVRGAPVRPGRALRQDRQAGAEVEPRVGDGHRPVDLHRLQRLHRSPARPRTTPDRRQGAGPAQPRDALDPHRPLLQGAGR
jgi:hypothetical protein